MKLNKQQKLGIAFAVVGISMMTAFQNCGAGFEVLRLNSAEVASGGASSSVPKLAFDDGPHKLVGDMVMQEKVFENLQKAPTGLIRVTSNLPAGLVPWPAGRIPIIIPQYVFDPTLDPLTNRITFTPLRPATPAEFNAFRTTVAEVCRLWSEVGNITCVIDSNSTTDRLTENTLTALILDDSDVDLCGPNKTVSCAKIGGPGMTNIQGFTTTRPWMAIRTANISTLGLVLHEMGHVLGLLHEHQRADAGKYLMVSPALSEADRSAYLMLKEYVGVIPNAAFDFGSVMAYPMNGEMNAAYLAGTSPLAIRSEYYLNGAHLQHAQAGRVSGRPSIQDVETIRAIYGAPNPAGRASCSLNGQIIPHGSQIAVYGAEATSAVGFTSCPTTSRKCDNGVLSGTGSKMTCNIHCGLGGVEVKYAASRDFYKTATVSVAGTCEKQSRTCTQASGLTVPAGMQPFAFSSCTLTTPTAVTCASRTQTLQSTANSIGERTTCMGTLPTAPSRPGIRVSGTASNGGTFSGECGAADWINISGTCPQPADPPPANAPVYCMGESRVFESTANSIGMKTTCVASLPQTLAGNTIVPTSVSRGGTFTASCTTNGSVANIRQTCPPPAEPVAPPAVDTPAVFSCTPTKAYLQAYTMSGTIKPSSSDAGKPGYFFVAGYDVVAKNWWSFDGRDWTKHEGTADSSFSAIGGVNTLVATGISGPIFVNADLRPFPNGQLYVGYGIGGTKIEAWDQMVAATRYRLCDVLPSEPDECINRFGQRIQGCIYR